MDTHCLIFINCISLLLLFIVLAFWRNTRRQLYAPEIFDLVAFFTSSKIILYFLLPAILRGYSDWAKDKVIGATPVEIANVYTIEFISLIVWMVCILLTLRITRVGRPIANINHGGKSMWLGNNASIITERTAKLFMMVVCLLYLIFFPYTYEESLNLSLGKGSLIQPVMMLAGPVVGLYLFARGRKPAGNILFGLGMVVVVLSMMAAFGGGSRGQIMFAALWLLFLYFFVTRKKYILYSCVAGVALVLLAHDIMLQIRAQPDLLDQPYKERAIGMARALSTEKNESDLIGSLEFRFGVASRMSVAFLRLVNDGQSAGFKPIMSSLYAMIPRKYFPDKPIQGSVDGTMQGMGMYIINIVMEGSGMMSEFFTGVHAYWELGLPGVFLFSSLSGIFIALCIGYFGRFASAGLPLMMIMLKPPWLETKLWIAETIADVFHTLVPLIVLWYLIRFVVARVSREQKENIGIGASPGANASAGTLGRQNGR